MAPYNQRNGSGSIFRHQLGYVSFMDAVEHFFHGLVGHVRVLNRDWALHAATWDAILANAMLLDLTIRMNSCR
jgi:hypothetical protein